jgi:hypothetical protein
MNSAIRADLGRIEGLYLYSLYKLIEAKGVSTMPDSLTKIFGANFDLATTDGRTSQHEYTPEAEAIYREGKLHEIAQLVYASKTVKAINQASKLTQHAVTSMSQFSAEAFTVAENVCRTPACQAYFEASIQPLLSLYPEHIRGLVQVGVTNIAQEASKNVAVKPPKKWWWEK